MFCYFAYSESLINRDVVALCSGVFISVCVCFCLYLLFVFCLGVWVLCFIFYLFFCSSLFLLLGEIGFVFTVGFLFFICLVFSC